MLWDVTSPAQVFQIRMEQMRHYLYLIIDIATIFVPFFFSFHPRLKFHKKFKAFFPAMVLSGCAYLSWDIYFTVQGIWGFNPDYLMALRIWQLPIEEVLFFVCIPFACVFSCVHGARLLAAGGFDFEFQSRGTKHSRRLLCWIAPRPSFGAPRM